MAKIIAAVLVLLSAEMWAQCSLCQSQVDLVTNGDFSNGNQGFVSDLQYVTGIFTCPLCPENTYTIGANAVFYHSGFAGTDHTNPPTGSFFIANGMGALGSTAWCQTMPVQTQTDYTFSFWARDVTNNNDTHPMANLFASFNGVWSADSIVAQGGWSQFVVTWNSGNASLLELCIINNQWQTGGNDFGLDDISLTACEDIHLAQPAYAGQDVSVCSDESTLLGQVAATNYQYTWIPDTGLDLPNSAQPTCLWSNHTDADVVHTYVVVRDSANVGCIATDTIQVTVRHVPIYSPLSDTIVCPNDLATYAQPLIWPLVLWDGQWSAQSIDLPSGDHSVAVSYNSCDVEDEFTITIEPMPNLDLPALYEVCAPEELVLQFDAQVWWSDETYSDQWIGFESTELAWYYEQNGCTFNDSTSIIVQPEPNWILSTDSIGCDNETLNIDPSWPGDWDIPGEQQILTTNQAGDYVFTAQSGSCLYYFPLHLRFEESPILPADAVLDFCIDKPMWIGVDAMEGIDYSWQNGALGSWLEPDSAGLYRLYAQNFCGLDSMELDLIEIVCSSDLYIPNTFTPNEDAINDAWLPVGHDIMGYHLIIYDQLGKAIFETRDWTQSWSPGTGRIDWAYTYRLEYQDYLGKYHELTGHINVLR